MAQSRASVLLPLVIAMQTETSKSGPHRQQRGHQRSQTTPHSQRGGAVGTYEMTDHDGNRLVHGRPNVNGVNIHYAMGGSGDPVFLLHGVPKTMYFWRKVIPFLTPHYTVIAVDCRGYGDSERPYTGYDTQTMAPDIVELANFLRVEKFRIVGEDWGAAIAYAVAAFHRDR